LRRLALAFPVAARACSIHSGDNEEQNVLMSSGTVSLKAKRAALSLMIDLLLRSAFHDPYARVL
jgi:hypothetical protein